MADFTKNNQKLNMQIFCQAVVVGFGQFHLILHIIKIVFLKKVINKNEGVTLSCLFCQAGILEITGIFYKGIFTNMIFANDMTFLFLSFQPW